MCILNNFKIANKKDFILFVFFVEKCYYFFVKKEKNIKKERLFKKWYRICEPSKYMWFMQIFLYVLYAIIYSLMAIFAAKTINCLVEKDWKGAFIWLGVEFLDILVRNVVYHIQYLYYGKHYGYIQKNVTTKIFNKIFQSEEKGLERLTSEKIINIAQNNLNYVADFPDYIASILSYSIQVGIAIVTIFISNVYAGLIVIVLGIINFFVYNKVYKKLGKIMDRRYEKKDLSFQEYSKILNGKPVIEELHAGEDYKTKLLEHVDAYGKEYKKYYDLHSFLNQIYFVIWNFVVYAITAFLIYLVSQGSMDLAVYLVIVPYLTSCITKLNELYVKFGSIENMRADIDRINVILSLDEKQLVQYGNVNKESQGYNLGFIDVSYKNTVTGNNFSNIDISMKMHGLNIIKGERNCGKRDIFNMLRRTIQPDSGIIMYDNLNLYDYSEKTFKNHIDYCSAHPYFIKGTVKENLLVANKNFSVIEAQVKELHLEEVINSLPQGYETPISDILEGETRFLIGLIRATLSKCKILMIYEYPDDVSENFHKILQHIISTSEGSKRTLIFFTHKDDYDNLADMLYEIKNGKIKLAKVTNKKNKA